MPLVLQNIKKVLKPNGHVLIRDYATGDLAQERLTCKDQQISDNFYVRGDGTRAYYFSEDFLASLFTQNGFDVEEVGVCNKQVENRSLELVMNRRWIQASFCLHTHNTLHPTKHFDQEANGHKISKTNFKNASNNAEIDLSESFVELFNASPSIDEIIQINLRGYNFRIKAVSKENQHTFKSTGLMLWESARLMSCLLAENPSIVAQKSMLELGCGSSGICSMISLPFAQRVVSTDGDTESLELLHQNVASNLEPGLIKKMLIKRLIWGNTGDIEVVKNLGGGFDVIIGTDVIYYKEAIMPLFGTASTLIANGDGEKRPALILCHIERRVDEVSILEAASKHGFKLVDRWINGMNSNDGIISSWFASGCCLSEFKNMPLSILYFEV